ncbi:quinone-dependent dihydroorotate dehydrogenase, partial [Klebsiella pneumoniae]|nr:quinone-dependent dihydroorotate dehydrogenase [Klebsiella pneumoniae]
EVQQKQQKYVLVAVNIAPVLLTEELIHIADSRVLHNIDGVIATKSPLDRSLVQGIKHCDESGGLSGRPLQLKSTENIRMPS